MRLAVDGRLGMAVTLTACNHCRHWEYQLNKLNIISIDVAEDQHSGVVLAAVQVNASHHKRQDQPVVSLLHTSSTMSYAYGMHTI